MKVRVLETPEGVARLVAGTLWQEIEGGARHLGLATGRTMIGIYRAFVELAKDRYRDWDWSTIETFNLDEYEGLGRKDKESFYHFMQSHLFSQVPLMQRQTHIPNGVSDDLNGECQRYEDLVKQKGIDVQLLGLGTNGHIGFNEPGTLFTARTHVVSLSQETLEQNQGDFAGRTPPRRALTMGIQSIMSAKRIILVATGASKAEALTQTLVGPVGPACPATALRLHQDVSVYLDRELWHCLELEGREDDMDYAVSIENPDR